MPVTAAQIAHVIAAAGPGLPAPQATATRRPLSTLAASLRQGPPETPEEVAKLKTALACLSPDVPRGNGQVLDSSGQPAPDYWLGVIWAIASLSWTCGEALAQDWSQPSRRYSDQGFDAAWNAYNPNHPNPVGIGSVYALALAKGWTATPAPPSTTRYKLLGRAAILALPPSTWLVKGVLPDTGLAAIFGPSGSGKSFLGFHLGVSIALGRNWFGHRVAVAPVTYVMLEGAGGAQKRLQAWELENGAQVPPTYRMLIQSFHLMSDAEVDELAAVLPKGGVVIIDTLNRAAPTAEENSSVDMGKILEGMSRLQALTQGLVIVVHHTGKDTSKGLRGHSSLQAALDAAIEVVRTENGRSWRLAKSKDGEDGADFPFSLKVHNLGRDADGDDITSCAIGPAASTLFTPKVPSGKDQKSALAVVRQALAASPHMGLCQTSPQTPCLKVEDAVPLVVATLAKLEPKRRSNRARTLIGDLTAGGFLKSGIDQSGEGWLW